MKKYFVLLLLFSLIFSCKSVNSKSSDSDTTSENTSTEDVTAYFKATGNEPFWGVKIGKEKIVFTSLIQGKENLSFSSVKPVRAMDSNIKTYKAGNATSSIIISIEQIECQDSMSEAISPYKVSIEIRSNTESNAQKMEGCGKYITDYRLHDIWVLEQLNGHKIL